MNLKDEKSGSFTSRRRMLSLVIYNAAKIFSLPKNLLKEMSEVNKVVIKKAEGSVAREKRD